MKTRYGHHDGPLGRLLLVKRGGRLAGIYFEDRRGGSPIEEGCREDPGGFARERAALDAYFAGEGELAALEVDLSAGTPFQRRVWEALRRIEPGRTRTYGELARELGSSPRAVGAANARNPVSIVVPCHRVIGADGDLVGYAGGLARKRWLLRHEAWSASRGRSASTASTSAAAPGPS